jgi:GTP-binding protein HflX
MRGPGETEIETDRRIVRDRIALLKKIKAIDNKWGRAN